MESMVMKPVAHVRGGRIPAEDDAWGSERARIELASGFGADALAGLDGFSHNYLEKKTKL